MVERHRHVQRVSDHHDVRRPAVEHDAVQRRVGLDHPASRLRLEPGEQRLLRLGEPVHPRRQLTQWRRQVGGAEQERQADLLHPGRSALGTGADHDVALAEGEPLPPVAVLLVGAVAARHVPATARISSPMSTSSTRARPDHLGEREPARLVGRAVHLVAQVAADDRGLEDHPDALVEPVPVSGALLGRDDEGVHAEQPAELDVVPGLLADLADRGLLDRLVQLDAAAGQRPLRLAGLVPQREQHPVALVDDHGVRAQPGVVLGVVQHGTSSLAWSLPTALGMNGARVGYGQV